VPLDDESPEAPLDDESLELPLGEEPPAPAADGGQSALAVEELPVPLLLVLGEAAWLPGGQSAAELEPPAADGELLDGELLEELLDPPAAPESEELVLGELELGELEYEPLEDCARAPAESASSALAVAAASKLSFMLETPIQSIGRCVVGLARNLCGRARKNRCKACSRALRLSSADEAARRAERDAHAGVRCRSAWIRACRPRPAGPARSPPGCPSARPAW